jgi:hypothetical protein
MTPRKIVRRDPGKKSHANADKSEQHAYPSLIVGAQDDLLWPAGFFSGIFDSF